MTDRHATPAEMLYEGIQLTRPLLRAITARVEADIQELGLTVGHRAVMEVLWAGGKASAPELTTRLQVKRQLVGRWVKEMVEAGLLATEPNPNRQKSHLYDLTPDSRAKIATLRAREMEQMATFAARFTEAEIAAYQKLQRALLKGMIEG